MKKIVAILVVIIAIVAGVYKVDSPLLNDLFGSSKNEKVNQGTTQENYDYKISFPSSRYPETAKHIEDAIANGASKICTIDREGAEENRKESLKDVPTRQGFDRDEYPMAMCSEGGAGADIEYISPKDNRGAGSWVSHELHDMPDGAKVLFEVK
ncbi:NucA/NucB deoxyribonuclease domain-containing protein [Bacillus velezensis]|uniref:NucA/NucB deoxyribonuclease domain-containing protein n=1 Tax=Bacillus amyloliquefaciens group TaxID=1938374 RepID=UPI002DBE0FB6|nr:NucA/NucB deoxyribonuclease domain-containing protein [Bacillus velezensis]MEC0385658.1 NucA/NucB deoxyribonuclease domain-containing protein [Bacillus velezensis]MEC0388799.1 NucA/NucB deoxyribonuclease domain-containing protein [Bacillus velezensis]